MARYSSTVTASVHVKASIAQAGVSVESSVSLTRSAGSGRRTSLAGILASLAGSGVVHVVTVAAETSAAGGEISVGFAEETLIDRDSAASLAILVAGERFAGAGGDVENKSGAALADSSRKEGVGLAGRADIGGGYAAGTGRGTRRTHVVIVSIVSCVTDADSAV